MWYQGHGLLDGDVLTAVAAQLCRETFERERLIVGADDARAAVDRAPVVVLVLLTTGELTHHYALTNLRKIAPVGEMAVVGEPEP